MLTKKQMVIQQISRIDNLIGRLLLKRKKLHIKYLQLDTKERLSK